MQEEKQKRRMTGNIESCHGLLAKELDVDWERPYCVAASNENNRDDHDSGFTAEEYLDEPEVLEKKMEIIANLVRKSNFVVAYTGAGLSRAAGLGDYASKANNSIVRNMKKIGSYYEVKPTFSHHVITKMEESGYLHHYIQQNHDGLPQKSGFPQEKINEIHGAWYDPSNNVIKFGGQLRSDLYESMLETEKKIDLCLCMGTSLSGMNADRCAISPANRYYRKKKGNGTIMINLQKTKIDDVSTIRVWAKIDDAMKILAEKLELDMTNLKGIPKHEGTIFHIPYDENGKYLGEDTKKFMQLDMSIGSKIKIVHPLSSEFGVVGEISKDLEERYALFKYNRNNIPVSFVIGKWWVDVGIRGALKQFPFANPEPVFVDENKQVIESSSKEEQSITENN